MTEVTEKRAWQISENDNVAVALEQIKDGDPVRCGEQVFKAGAEIPQGHKIACRRIAAGEYVKKYGVVIGEAKTDIEIGDYVHCHNVLDITEQLCNIYYDRYVKKGSENRE